MQISTPSCSYTSGINRDASVWVNISFPLRNLSCSYCQAFDIHEACYAISADSTLNCLCWYASYHLRPNWANIQIVCDAAAINFFPRLAGPISLGLHRGREQSSLGDAGCSQAGQMPWAPSLSYMMAPELQATAKAGQVAPAADPAAALCRTWQKGQHWVWPGIFQTPVAEEETSCRKICKLPFAK